MDTKVVEQCQISPSDGGVAQQSFPLVYFDLVGLRIHHMKTLYFYNLPNSSKPHFFDTILPNLNNSLSLALKHFLPLAGNIILPLNSGMPVSHYAAGKDSVSLTVAVSDSDFLLVTANHPKDTDVLYEFVPQIPSAAYSSDSVKFPVMALQITLFPKQGICIGVTCHHAICDGATLVCFLQTWASINKFKGEKHLRALGRKFLPVYDRSGVEDSDRLTPLMWEKTKKSRLTVSSAISFPTQKLRGTFVLRDEEILKLKNVVMLKKPGREHVSSNTAVCARMWSLLAAGAGEEVSDDEVEYLWIPVECRGKLRPPLPITYFGNCLTLVEAECAHGRLRGSGGFVAAAEAIEEALGRTLENEKGILDGCIEGHLRIMRLKEKGKRRVIVTGSPNFDFCGIDYGWGGMTKMEALNIDGSLSLSKTIQGVEVGITLPKLKMDAFASFFNKNITSHHVYGMQASKL